MKVLGTLAWKLWLLCMAVGVPLPCMAVGTWSPAHVVIVILENRSSSQVIGNRDAPYLNALANGAALMTRAYFAQTPYGIVPEGREVPLPTRPSQPNYLFLFSGHHQGVLPNWFQSPRSPYRGTALNDAAGDRLPRPVAGTPVGIGNDLIPSNWRPFNTPNLGAAVIASGRSFASFSESLPYPHYDSAADRSPIADLYRRKHNPAINWIGFGGGSVPGDTRRFILPVEVNLGFANTTDPIDGKRYRGFALDADGRAIGFDQLPTVSIVVPNEQSDAHSADLSRCDAWLRANIKPYADWARDHDSLLIVTFDEDGSTDASRGNPYRTGSDPIVTLFDGPADKVGPGMYDERVDHLNVLATVLDRYGLLDAFKRDFLQVHRGPEAEKEAASLRPIRDVFGEGPKLGPIRDPAR